MPYEFHIVRTRSWLDSESDPIAREEWERAADREERLEDAGTIDWLNRPSQRLFAWHDNGPSFDWSDGQVTVTGVRSKEIAAEIAVFAQALGARLVGDWDEEYDEEGEAHPLEASPRPSERKRSLIDRLLGR